MQYVGKLVRGFLVFREVLTAKQCRVCRGYPSQWWRRARGTLAGTDRKAAPHALRLPDMRAKTGADWPLSGRLQHLDRFPEQCVSVKLQKWGWTKQVQLAPFIWNGCVQADHGHRSRVGGGMVSVELEWTFLVEGDKLPHRYQSLVPKIHSSAMGCWAFLNKKPMPEPILSNTNLSLFEKESATDRENLKDARIRKWLRDSDSNGSRNRFSFQNLKCMYVEWKSNYLHDPFQEKCDDLTTPYWLPKRESDYDSCGSDL